MAHAQIGMCVSRGHLLVYYVALYGSPIPVGL